MNKITFTSKTHGSHTTTVDDIDYERLKKLNSMTWSVVKKRGKIYFSKNFSKKRVELHRWIMGEPDGNYIDHINGDTLDNTRKNLRICSNGANLRNHSHLRPNNTSGVTGVWFNKGRNKWVAEIKVSYKKISLGYFKSIQDAIKARKKAEKKYWSI